MTKNPKHTITEQLAMTVLESIDGYEFDKILSDVTSRGVRLIETIDLNVDIECSSTRSSNKLADSQS